MMGTNLELHCTMWHACDCVLQVLHINYLRCSTELINPLRGLSSLRELGLTLPAAAGSSAQGLEVVCQQG